MRKTECSKRKEKVKEALDVDPYAVAWTLKRKSKPTLDVVGLVPHSTVLSPQSKLSPVPRVVLEIIFKASLQ